MTCFGPSEDHEFRLLERQADILLPARVGFVGEA